MMIELTSPYVHYYNRGVNKDIIFFTPENYLFLIRRLEDYLKDYQVKLIAFCLLPNHYHILLKHECLTEGVRLIQRLFNSYTQAIKKRYSRVGTLFQGSVKKRFIEDDNYLMDTIKYIHLNPVKSRLCVRPEQWSYSDFREWVGKNESSRDIKSERDRLFGFPLDYLDFINSELTFPPNQ